MALLVTLSAAQAFAEPCADAKQCVAACRKKNRSACTRIGELLRAGVDERSLANKALKTLERACKKGNDETVCYQYGLTLVRLHPIGPNGSRGYRQLEVLCERRKHMDSCMHLAAMHESKDGVTLDIDRAVMLYERACKAKRPDACMRLARVRERTGRDTETLPDLFMAACAGGVDAGCQRQIALSQPEEPSDAHAWALADRFVSSCLQSQRDWIDRWQHKTIPRPTVKVIGHSTLVGALDDAIDGVSAVTRVDPIALLVVGDLDEVEVNVGLELMTHRVWSATLYEAHTGVLLCREALEVATAEKLPPAPGPTTPRGDLPKCLLSDRRANQQADAIAADILAAPWIDGFQREVGRIPRVRLGTVLNRTRRYLQLRPLMARVAKQLGESGRVVALSPELEAGEPADVVGVLHVQELSDVIRGWPVQRWQAVLELWSVETGQIVWLSDRVLHLCADDSERGCTIPQVELRAVVDELMTEATKTLDNHSRCPMNALRGGPSWLSTKPPIRVRRALNRTDEHIPNVGIFAAAALALDGRLTLLATAGSSLAAVDAENTAATQAGAGLVVSLSTTSIRDRSSRSYRVSAEILDSTTGEKLWLGDRNVMVECEQRSADPTW